MKRKREVIIHREDVTVQIDNIDDHRLQVYQECMKINYNKLVKSVERINCVHSTEQVTDLLNRLELLEANIDIVYELS